MLRVHFVWPVILDRRRTMSFLSRRITSLRRLPTLGMTKRFFAVKAINSDADFLAEIKQNKVITNLPILNRQWSTF
jgi:hypothetical protein